MTFTDFDIDDAFLVDTSSTSKNDTSGASTLAAVVAALVTFLMF